MSLLRFCRYGGCAAKAGASDLRSLLDLLSAEDWGATLAIHSREDVGVFRTPAAALLLQSIDVITPVSRNARSFGGIAAAHALNDLYAKGAKPVSGLISLGFPENEIPVETLAEIVSAAISKLKEADAVFLGGHTYFSPELVVGVAVTGAAERIVENSNAQIGDRLFISKPIGTGVIIAAEKYNEEESVPALTAMITEAAEMQMLQLNAAVANLLQSGKVNSATDVSGFGLIGHLVELLGDNAATLFIENVPTLPGALQLLSEGFLPTGADRNIAEWSQLCDFQGAVAAQQGLLLFDPQTNGGVLMCVPVDEAREFRAAARDQGVPVTEIGVITPPPSPGSGIRITIR